MTNPPQDPEEDSPAFDRGAESAARLVLALVPVLGPVLAEAVGYARSVYDDEQDAAFQAEVKRRLGALEASDSPPTTPAGGRTVRFSGDRARLLELLIRRAGEQTLRRVETREIMEKLELTADACRRAIRELVDLGVVEADGNGNDPTGYARAAVYPYIYVEQIGRLDPSIDVRRELGQILRVLERAGEDRRVRRDEFVGLGIPARRFQVLAEYLEGEELAQFHGPGYDKWMFLDAELTTKGWRVLRGDDVL